MKTPLTYGAYRILHDLFKNGVTFKRALHRENYSNWKSEVMLLLTPTTLFI